MPIDSFNDEVFQFIQDHIHENAADIALQAQRYSGLPVKEIAGQIASRQKAKNKLPEWYAHTKIIFPPRENLEQASSEITARFKGRDLRGRSLADLTGGSGVDLFYMSQNFKKSVYVEPDPALQKLAEYNFNILGRQIETELATAEIFLESIDKKFDVIYLDPSRRDENKQRIFALDQYQPNVIQLYPALMETASQIIIKISPMADITHTLRLLPDTFKVQVVAVDNEVKELLFFLNPGYSDEPVIEAWNLSDHADEMCFKFGLEEERTSVAEIGSVEKYIYDSNSAIRKAGAYNVLAERYNLKKLGIHTHLYTSKKLIADFPGRIFEIMKIIKPNKKEIHKRFPERKVNVLTRNFPARPDALKNKFGLKDGGNEFLIFCDLQKSGKAALICKRI